ncbi:hypothetical protein AB0L40_09275 [Patulibacter sp. NPDC049589]|uniref:DUF7065 domain-containing protein n=1 Tax=Patulibacter sp. NPDC049589 TaxID=3154731 RepID=UPI0034145896
MLQHHDDDSIHTASDAPTWRESFYCNFADTESRYYGVAWQGVRPNQEVAEAVFVLFDRETALIRSVQTQLPVAADTDRRAVGNQTFTCHEPWRHWSVTFDDGTSNLTVDWQQLSEVCDHDATGTPGRPVDPDTVEAPDEASFYGAAKHFEATGRIEASGEVDGRPISFTGFGTRDRAWGPRNWGLLGFCWWQTTQFADGDAVHALLLQEKVGDDMSLFGMLHRDGRTRPAMLLECEIGYDGEPGPPTSARQRWVDDEGRELIIESMQLLAHQPFAILADGQNLEPRTIETPEENAYFWTWQRFVRDDGVVGHGMIDQACWSGMQHTTFASTVPTGKLYDYGVSQHA